MKRIRSYIHHTYVEDAAFVLQLTIVAGTLAHKVDSSIFGTSDIYSVCHANL